ncbi:MAG: metal-sensing transcriptional repressor [Acholeplasma sp.]|nr:metal-sensing transcriptional repressor [Acholeplasma sp.]
MKHDQALKTLKISKGQIEAVIKMIEEQRYCIDISNQIQAAIALVKKAQKEVITEHLNHCVKESFEQNNATEKIKEIEYLLDKVIG